MYLVFQHGARHYRRWRPIFARHADARQKHGEVSSETALGWDNRATVLVVCKFPSRDHIQRLFDDPTVDAALFALDGDGHVRLLEESPLLQRRSDWS
jgi:uncharacterized protein (DUF1330 family)